MEFSLDSFYQALVDNLRDNFPYMFDDELDKDKHPNRNPLHLKNAVFDNLQMYRGEDSITFDIGNERLEQTHPYYHILQNSEVIRVRGKGTKKSKGSQDKVKELGKRDYERVSWNGKTFTKEYSRNVRGSRTRRDSGRKVVVGTDGVVYRINQNANYYVNIYYHYIDRILDTTLPWIAQELGLKMKRKEDTGLLEEMNTQEDDKIGNILNILDSFNY